MTREAAERHPRYMPSMPICHRLRLGATTAPPGATSIHSYGPVGRRRPGVPSPRLQPECHPRSGGISRPPRRVSPVKVGYAGVIGALANIDEQGRASMCFFALPSIMDYEPYSGDFGQAFYGHAYNAAAYIVDGPEFGWRGFAVPRPSGKTDQFTSANRLVANAPLLCACRSLVDSPERTLSRGRTRAPSLFVSSPRPASRVLPEFVLSIPLGSGKTAELRPPAGASQVVGLTSSGLARARRS
jgi:Family of unknown function (DUF5695)